MTSRIALPLLIACLALSAHAQMPAAPLSDLPASPSASSPTSPSFQLPKSPTGASPISTVVARSSGAAPDPHDDEIPFCSALSDTSFRFDKPLSPAQKKEMQDFMSPVKFRISVDWYHRVPRLISSAWQKDKVLLVRFDIDHAGAVTNEELVMSSGRGLHDKAALKAIADAAPLQLPADLPEPAHLCLGFKYIYSSGPDKRSDPLEPYKRPLKTEGAAPATAPVSATHSPF